VALHRVAAFLRDAGRRGTAARSRRPPARFRTDNSLLWRTAFFDADAAPRFAPSLRKEFAMNTASLQTSAGFQLRFRSLHREGRGYAFPCDERGCVPMDALSERARNNYLFARAMVGRDYAPPELKLA
jgi:hypothetical protein